MSLLQDVLRSKTEDIDRRLNNVRLTRRAAHLDNDDSDDEIVNVVSQISNLIRYESNQSPRYLFLAHLHGQDHPHQFVVVETLHDL